MKRFGIIALLSLMLMGFGEKASAQFRPDVPDLKGKFIYGGNFGFGMSGYYLNLSLAPQVGYRVFNPWEVGVRGIYNFQCYFDRVYGNQYSHFFGVAPFTNFQFYKGFFVHVEDEVMYGFSQWNHETQNGRWYNTVFAGGGYRQYSYSGSFAYIMLLYNLSWGLWKPVPWDTPYATPLEIRFGYCF